MRAGRIVDRRRGRDSHGRVGPRCGGVGRRPLIRIHRRGCLLLISRHGLVVTGGRRLIVMRGRRGRIIAGGRRCLFRGRARRGRHAGRGLPHHRHRRGGPVFPGGDFAGWGRRVCRWGGRARRGAMRRRRAGHARDVPRTLGIGRSRLRLRLLDRLARRAVVRLVAHNKFSSRGAPRPPGAQRANLRCGGHSQAETGWLAPESGSNLNLL